MVAIGILGLAVTLILSAQGGLASTNKSAANMGVAIELGRCRMTELEEKLLKLGYSEVDEIDSSTACCDDKETPGFSCDWRVEKVVLPDPPNTGAGDGGLNFGAMMEGGIPGLAGAGAAGVGPSIPGLLGGDGGIPTLDLDAGLQAIGQQMGMGGSGALGLLSMVFTIIYPSLKPVLEASIRRLTVTVKWSEGLTDRELSLVQYVTNPMRAGLAAGANIDGGIIGEGGVGQPTTGAGGAGTTFGAPTPGAVPGRF
jgi:general secretion pathway protein I